MSLPDFPRYIRQRGDEWQGADHPNGPWRPIPAPQQALPWPTDGPAVQSREPASVTPEATGQPRPLSPAAQAVLDAANGNCVWGPDDYLNDSNWIAAAALRAAADRVVEEVSPVEAILAIAAELEGAR